MVFAVSTAKTQLSNLQVIYDAAIDGTYFKATTNPPLEEKKFFDANINVMPKDESGKPDYSRIAKIKSYGSQQGNIFSVFAQNFTLGRLVSDNRSDYAVEMSIGAENPCPERIETKCCYFGKDDRKYSAIIYSAPSGCTNPVRVDIKKPVKAEFKQNYPDLTGAQTALEELFAIEKKEKIILTNQCVIGERIGKLAISLAIDNSGSMDCGNTPGKSKLAQAQDEYIRIIRSEVLKNEDLVSIEGISFDTKATVINPENNRGKVINAISSLKAGGNTALFDATRRAIMAVAPKDGYTKIAIIFTDGNENQSVSCPGCDGNRDLTISKAKEIAALARANNVKLFTIGLGDLTPSKGLPPEVWCQKQGESIRIDIDRGIMESLAGDTKRFINIKSINQLEGHIKNIINEGMTMFECGKPPPPPPPPSTSTVPQYYMPELQIAGECKKKENAGKCDYEVCITAKCVANPPTKDAIAMQDWCNPFEAGFSLFGSFKPSAIPKKGDILWNVYYNEDTRKNDYTIKKSGYISIGNEETYCAPIKAISNSSGAIEKESPMPFVKTGKTSSAFEFKDEACNPQSECVNIDGKREVSLSCSAQDIPKCGDSSSVSLNVSCQKNGGQPCKDLSIIIKLPDGAIPDFAKGLKFDGQDLPEDRAFRETTPFIIKPNAYRYLTSKNAILVKIAELKEGETKTISYPLKFDPNALAYSQNSIKVANADTSLLMLTPGWTLPELSKNLGKDCLAKKSETGEPYLEIAKSIAPNSPCSDKYTAHVDIKCKDECGNAGCKNIIITDNFYAYDNDLAGDVEKKYNSSAKVLRGILKNLLPPKYVPGSARGAGVNAAIINNLVGQWKDPYGLDRNLNIEISKLAKDQSVSYEYDVEFLEQVAGANVNYPSSVITMGKKSYDIHQKASYSTENCGNCVPKFKRIIKARPCKNIFDIEAQVSCEGGGETDISEIREIYKSNVKLVGAPNFPKPSPTIILDPSSRRISAQNFKISQGKPYSFTYSLEYAPESPMSDGASVELINDLLPLGSVATYIDPKTKMLNVVMDKDEGSAISGKIDYSSCQPDYEVIRSVVADSCEKTATVTLKFRCTTDGGISGGCKDFSFNDYYPEDVVKGEALIGSISLVPPSNNSPAKVTGSVAGIVPGKWYEIKYKFAYNDYGKDKSTINNLSNYSFAGKEVKLSSASNAEKITLEACGDEYVIKREANSEPCSLFANITTTVSCINPKSGGVCAPFTLKEYEPEKSSFWAIGNTNAKRTGQYYALTQAVRGSEKVEFPFRVKFTDYGQLSTLNDLSSFISGNSQKYLKDIVDSGSQTVSLTDCAKGFSLSRNVVAEKCEKSAVVTVTMNCKKSSTGFCPVKYFDILPEGVNSAVALPRSIGSQTIQNGKKGFLADTSVPVGSTVIFKYRIYYKDFGLMQSALDKDSYFVLEGEEKAFLDSFSAPKTIDIEECKTESKYHFERTINPQDCEPKAQVILSFTCDDPGTGNSVCNIKIKDYLPDGAIIDGKSNADYFAWETSVKPGETKKILYNLIYDSEGKKRGFDAKKSTFSINGGQEIPLTDVMSQSNIMVNSYVDLSVCIMQVMRTIKPIECTKKADVEITFQCITPGNSGYCWEPYGIKDFLPPNAKNSITPNKPTVTIGMPGRIAAPYVHASGEGTNFVAGAQSADSFVEGFYKKRLVKNQIISIKYQIEFEDYGSYVGISKKSEIAGFAGPSNLIEFIKKKNVGSDPEKKIDFAPCTNKGKISIPFKCANDTSQPPADILILVDASPSVIESGAFCKEMTSLQSFAKELVDSGKNYRIAVTYYLSHAISPSYSFVDPKQMKAKLVDPAMRQIFNVLPGQTDGNLIVQEACRIGAQKAAEAKTRSMPEKERYNYYNSPYIAANDLCKASVDLGKILDSAPNDDKYLFLLMDLMPHTDMISGVCSSGNAVADLQAVIKRPKTKTSIIAYDTGIRDDADDYAVRQNLYGLAPFYGPFINDPKISFYAATADGKLKEHLITASAIPEQQCTNNRLQIKYPSELKFLSLESQDLELVTALTANPIIAKTKTPLNNKERREATFSVEFSGKSIDEIVKMFCKNPLLYNFVYSYDPNISRTIPVEEVLFDGRTYQCSQLNSAKDLRMIISGMGQSGVQTKTSKSTTLASPKPTLIPKSQADSLLNLINALKIKK